MVKVVSVSQIKKDDFTYVYVGRASSYKPEFGLNGSAYGNPFYMANESQREKVCDKYKDHFYKVMMKDAKLKGGLDRLKARHEGGEKIALVCFCAPKQCHADTICSYLYYGMHDWSF